MNVQGFDEVKDGKAKWIWLKDDVEEQVNVYVQFRHEFSIEGPVREDASLFISVDTDYAVWLNGRFVNCGQYDDFPENKAYDVLPVGSFLEQGRNVICILAYHQGENSHQYIKGEPGLVYSLDCNGIKAASGEGTMCRKCNMYKSGPMPKVSSQLGFTFEYNAGNDDIWIGEDYTMGDEWHPASPAEWSNKNRQTLYRRPVSKLEIKDRITSRIITQGVFLRIPDDNKTIAQKMQTDFLSVRLPDEVFIQGSPDAGVLSPSVPCPDLLLYQQGVRLQTELFKENQGIYLVLDLERQEAGLFDIELESDDGAIVDIAYGEHLLDLRVKANPVGRNFADRYICREGRQRFTHYFTRFGCRYIQLHISNVKNRFVLYYAGLLPAEYPVESRGEFNCSDLLHEKIYSVSERTLHLCMHEHYEDTPWREQALYVMDARNEALCGYYCFGEYDYPRVAYSLLAESIRDDGYLEMCTPARPRRTIPSFSMIWFLGLYEYYLYSGRIDFIRQMVPTMKKMLEKYRNYLRDNLLPTPVEDCYWNYYECADGLNGQGPDDKKRVLRFDAPLNLFMYMALNAAEKLFGACNDNEAAVCAKLKDEMGKAIHEAFWDNEQQAYVTSIFEDVKKRHYAELTQALAIYTGACPADVAQELRKRLSEKNNGLVPITLSYSIFKYEALLMEKDKYGTLVFDDIAEQWSYMLYNNATSFWETIDAIEKSRQGHGFSFCHGWSAIPVYLYHAYILGVKPAEPGFEKFRTEPARTGICKAWGTVPTPKGDIKVSICNTGEDIKCCVTHPDEVQLDE